jgi:antitoxin YefM
MTRTLSMSEARELLTRLPEQFDQQADLHAVTVTRRGEPVLAVLPYDLYESIMETMEIMSDPDLLNAVRDGLADILENRTVSLDQLEERLAR